MGQKGGRDVFITKRFNTWNKAKYTFRFHVGDVDSFHNKAREKCNLLMREKQAINLVLRRQTEAEDNKYKARLRVFISACRYFLKFGSMFRGQNDSVGAVNRGNYIGVIKTIDEHSEDISIGQG